MNTTSPPPVDSTRRAASLDQRIGHRYGTYYSLISTGPNTGISRYRLTVVKFEEIEGKNCANFTTVNGSKVF